MFIMQNAIQVKSHNELLLVLQPLGAVIIMHIPTHVTIHETGAIQIDKEIRSVVESSLIERIALTHETANRCS